MVSEVDEEILNRLPEWYRTLRELYLKMGDKDRTVAKDGNEGIAKTE